MNSYVKDVGIHFIHKYGCCGMFFFFVARKEGRCILKRSFKTIKDAETWSLQNQSV